WLYTKQMPSIEGKLDYQGSAVQQLHLTLTELKDDYDYIFIDTPPALSEQTTNALAASDFVIVLYECSKFCYSAIDNFMETVELISTHIKYVYDYIFIDTPPALSEQTTNALAACDFVIVLYECSKFCYSVIDNSMETVELIQSTVKKELVNLGISRTLSDNRRK